MDSAEFSQSFHPATTMSAKPTDINFALEKVAAIVLPETGRETSIEVDSTYISNNTLYINFRVVQGTEERTFSTIPVKILSIDKDLPADSVVFVTDGVIFKTAFR
jgi:hypothetical protein